MAKMTAFVSVLLGCALIGFVSVSALSWAEEKKVDREPQSEMSEAPKSRTKAIYPKKSEIDLDATVIQGELKNPGDFYFQVKPEDKMDSLVKRRKNFHRQMLRDVMFSK